MGITETFDLPARQSYVIKMVGEELLPSAIALNGTAFNMARVVGPAIAGIALIWVGITGILIINSLSFFAVVIAIYSMRISESPKMQKAHPVNAIQKGLSYVLNHSMIKPMIFLTAMCSIFGWPYSTLLPVFAKDVLGQGASGLGYLYSSAGLGAVVGSLITSTFSVRFGTTRFVFVGMVLAGLSILSLSFANNIAFGVLHSFLNGF
ncbi:MAG: MFS transporter [Rhodocyclaceae bacterium]|nr:MFS transporter [Rhodocyclaceae bacterium]